jgi:5'(3')-deoxyribonucleotidase
MRKPVVAVDMDDTICHLIRACVAYHNKTWPSHPLAYEDMVSWNTDHIRHPECTEQMFFARPGLYAELELFDEYVIDELRKIHEAYDLIIVTASPSMQATAEKWEWLQRHAPFIPWANFCPWKRKDLVDFDIIVDDGAHNLIPALGRGKQVLCIPHPWNQDSRDKHNFPIMSSWKGAKERIDEILRRR